MSTEVESSVEVAAPAAQVFAAMTDWRRQCEWMLGTMVRIRSGDGSSVGSRIAAITGVGPLGVTDTMTITRWQPPEACHVRHTGRVVRGTGVFAVRALDEQRSRVIWSESLRLPLGVLGTVGFALLRPVFLTGLRYSLDRFATFAVHYRPAEER